jgi:hypothetical protein
MTIKLLPERSQDAVLQCLKAILIGPFIDEWEFQTRLGIDRDGLRSVLGRWPNLEDSEQGTDDFLAVNNCLNEVCYGVDIPAQAWDEWFTLPRTEVERAYEDWLATGAGKENGEKKRGHSAFIPGKWEKGKEKGT